MLPGCSNGPDRISMLNQWQAMVQTMRKRLCGYCWLALCTSTKQEYDSSEKQKSDIRRMHRIWALNVSRPRPTASEKASSMGDSCMSRIQPSSKIRAVFSSVLPRMWALGHSGHHSCPAAQTTWTSLHMQSASVFQLCCMTCWGLASAW